MYELEFLETEFNLPHYLDDDFNTGGFATAHFTNDLILQVSIDFEVNETEEEPYCGMGSTIKSVELERIKISVYNATIEDLKVSLHEETKTELLQQIENYLTTEFYR